MSKFQKLTSSATIQVYSEGKWTASSLARGKNINAVKIQTSDGNFYVEYQAYSTGYGWYPPVSSRVNDYAGSLSKSMQALRVKVYDAQGQKLNSKYIVMYRTGYISDDTGSSYERWLPWVSNATPDRMKQLQQENPSLFENIDVSGAYAGMIANSTPITCIQIEIYKETSTGTIIVPTSGLQYMVNNTWNQLTSSTRSKMHGIKLAPTNGKPYHLKYRTYNTGYGWYPYVTTLQNDYAGSSGKNIEAIQIQVIDTSTGVKLNDTHVIMYRAYHNGKWLPWVSNAAPSVMQTLKIKHNLDGDIDEIGSNAGSAGKGIGIDGFDIRVFEYVSNDDNNGNTSDGVGGNETFSQMYRTHNGAWQPLNNEVCVSAMDGLRFSTNASTPYRLKYRVYTANRGWLPYVFADQNDYAGVPNDPIQGLDIRVCDKSGNNIHSPHVVMYRAQTDGSWLPWVSNGSPEAMRFLQDSKKLGGKLDGSSWYVGVFGKNIQQLEIRIYTDVAFDDSNTEVSNGITTVESGGSGPKIYIDAGHGGSDSGAFRFGSMPEKTFTLLLSLKQAQYFKKLGYNVKLSRNVDCYHSLAERSADANKWGADFFISNHINSTAETTGTASGVEVYYSAYKNDNSKTYATAVSQAIAKAGFLPNRGPKTKTEDGEDYFHVIRETKMPALLIEHGFINNSFDLAALNNPTILNNMAQAAVNAIHNLMPNKPSVPEPSVDYKRETLEWGNGILNKHFHASDKVGFDSEGQNILVFDSIPLKIELSCYHTVEMSDMSCSNGQLCIKLDEAAITESELSSSITSKIPEFSAQLSNFESFGASVSYGDFSGSFSLNAFERSIAGEVSFGAMQYGISLNEDGSVSVVQRCTETVFQNGTENILYYRHFQIEITFRSGWEILKRVWDDLSSQEKTFIVVGGVCVAACAIIVLVPGTAVATATSGGLISNLVIWADKIKSFVDMIILMFTKNFEPFLNLIYQKVPAITTSNME